jgi:single-strand DNA-binding protein
MNSSLRRVFTQFVRRSSSQILSASEVTAAEAPANSVGKERSLNLIQLIGRVGQDPKVGGLNTETQQSTSKSHKVVLFSLATNEYIGNDQTSGEAKSRVDWHRITVFSPRLQENVEKYVRQGDRIHVTGRLHYNLVRDKAGEQRYITSIIADDIIFLTKFA